MQILGRTTSANVQKVVWLMTELGLAYERADVGGKFGGNRTAEYLSMNPNGRVPTLIDGDEVIWESNTILRYLANQYGPTPLYPQDSVLRSECERWMDWQLSTLNAPMTPLFQMMVRMTPEQRDPEVVAKHLATARAEFELLDTSLAARPYLGGEAFTLGDICVGVIAYRWFELPIERGTPLPNLARWFEAVASRPGFQQHVVMPLS
ncbi:glutathione S-transferase [Sphingomonas histidinilytica]|uniref:glutathione S-transferase family protein n=1 Tax=Rhizorhabdus histidinilytica TaxID=439228 RepID=UPI001ADB9F25|nr:glutathione S-transferase family protein [Rhizorhabdus histidinilytica]MBO9378820.1 glutathione S-transferase [Rhizorhabdus histidinilytica]